MYSSRESNSIGDYKREQSTIRMKDLQNSQCYILDFTSIVLVLEAYRKDIRKIIIIC